MASRDQFQRFLFEHSQVRGAWVQLGESFKEITGQAPYPDSVRELLGESLVASVLMSSTLKFKGTLSLQAAGEGALSTLMAECSHDRHIRGLARFDADAVSGETLHELLGKSRMAITITPEQGQRYQAWYQGNQKPWPAAWKSTSSAPSRSPPACSCLPTRIPLPACYSSAFPAIPMTTMTCGTG